MAGLSTAGVEFSGDLMRYAEVEHADGHYRLLRLGNCEFEFNASDVVFGTGPVHLRSAVREALGDIFRDTEASVFRFVIPSHLQTRFTTAVPLEADVNQRSALIGYETRLFTGNREGGDVFPAHLRTNPDTGAQRFAVSHIDESVSEVLRDVVSVFPGVPVQLAPSMMATTLAFRHIAHREQLPGRFYLVLGCQEDSTDIILMQGAEPLTQDHVRTVHPADTAYQALLACSRFGRAWHEVDGVLVYGPRAAEVSASALPAAFGDRVRTLNPGVIVDLEDERFGPDFPIEAFVPVIGSAIQ